MNKERKLKDAYKLWVVANSNSEDAYDAEIDLIDLCAEYDFVNDYIKGLDASNNAEYEKNKGDNN